LRRWSLGNLPGALTLLAAVAIANAFAAPSPEPLAYGGRVLDKINGKPVKDATVVVRRVLPGGKVLEESKHQTDVEGKYRFTLSPEQAAQPRLAVQVEATHPDYVAGWSSEDLSWLRKLPKLGERPPFERIELIAAKAITGAVVTPDGKPAAGVMVHVFSTASGVGSHQSETKTDDKGRFRLVITATGDAIIDVLADHHAPYHMRLAEKKRGDLGVLSLKAGIKFTGKVVDFKGKPLPGILVSASPHSDPRTEDPLPGRQAATNGKGEFAMAPLPAGSYVVRPIGMNANRPEKGGEWRAMPAAFVGQLVTLKQNVKPEPVELRAIPGVDVETRVLDSKGKPYAHYDLDGWLQGFIDDAYWSIDSLRTDAHGKIVIHVPKGLQAPNESEACARYEIFGGGLRHRMAKGAPLNNSRHLELGTLEKGIEIIRYDAPILLVNVSAKDSGALKDVKVTAQYPEDRSVHPDEEDEPDVSFEKQADGRFRSLYLLPDEEATLTVKAKGYKPHTQKVKLVGGAIKEVEAVLSPGTGSDETVERPSARAVKAIEKLGGTIERDKRARGKPVTRVDLSKCDKLTDADLKELKPLKKIRSLTLTGTEVTDAGLKELKTLRILSFLNLTGTHVTDAGLKQLKGFKYLRRLELSDTEVTDDGLKELRDLKCLYDLELDSTRITDAGLKELRNLTNLSVLNLAHTKVTDAGLKELKGLKRELRVLLLAATKVSDAGLKEFKDLHNLQCLNLQATKVTDAGLKELKELKRELMVLLLGNTPVTDAGLKHLKGMEKLETLELEATQVTDAGLKELKTLKSLQQLVLTDTRVTDAGLKEFKGLKKLQLLNLSGTQVTDAGLKELKAMTNLRDLNLAGTQVTDAGEADLQKALPKVEIHR
jgi:Leucine-rich repeat (LRR) protein/uncharacterized GH25 family protein